MTTLFTPSKVTDNYITTYIHNVSTSTGISVDRLIELWNEISNIEVRKPAVRGYCETHECNYISQCKKCHPTAKKSGGKSRTTTPLNNREKEAFKVGNFKNNTGTMLIAAFLRYLKHIENGYPLEKKLSPMENAEVQIAYNSTSTEDKERAKDCAALIKELQVNHVKAYLNGDLDEDELRALQKKEAKIIPSLFAQFYTRKIDLDQFREEFLKDREDDEEVIQPPTDDEDGDGSGDETTPEDDDDANSESAEEETSKVFTIGELNKMDEMQLVDAFIAMGGDESEVADISDKKTLLKICKFKTNYLKSKQ